MGGYVVAHLKRDIVQLGEKLRRILFSKCICFYWFLVFLKFWIFGILNTYFSTTISVISDLVLLSFELRILNFGFFKSHCQPLNFGFFLWSWALKTRLEGSVFFAGGVLLSKKYTLNLERWPSPGKRIFAKKITSAWSDMDLDTKEPAFPDGVVGKPVNRNNPVEW